MRLIELSLERYGVFEQRTLSFGEKPGLTIVYGPNEAGKSTSLAAITDFLFTVPPQSRHAAVFGGNAIRIGAVMKLADGEILSLKRRKGNGRTLTDDAGAVVEETVLSRLLGGTSRDRFETLFGLDHDGLRKGGAQLLTSKGDIGRLIVEAGGGLRGLVERMSEVDAQIDLLFDTRRSEKRAFYRALDTFEAADRSVKDGTVSLEQYDRLRAAHDATQALLEALSAEQAGLTLAATRLERIGRVGPLLRQLDQVRDQLNDGGALPDLPVDFTAQVTLAQDEAARAASALEAAKVRVQELEDRLEALKTDPVTRGLEAQVRDATEAAVHVTKARDDRANRLKELAESDLQLEGLRRRLGLGAADDLTPRLPAPDKVEALQQLAAAAQRREPAMASALDRARDLEADVVRLTGAVAAGVAKGHDRGVGVSVAELAGLPSAVLAHDQQADAVEDLQALARRRSSALGYDSPEALETEPFPLADMLEQENTQRHALQAEHLRLARQRTEAEGLLSVAERDIERLTAGAEIATDAALTDARHRRTEALEPLRAAHLAGAWTGSDADRAGEVSEADEALRLADELADRHAAEAQRAAEFAQATRQLEAASASLEAATKGLEDLDKLLAARDEALALAFPLAVGRFPQLEALRAGQQERADILRLWSDARGRKRDLDQASAAFGAQLELLSLAEQSCGVAVDDAAAIGDRVRAALTAVRDHDAAHADHRRDLGELQKASDALAGAQDQLRRLQADEAQWRTAWAPAAAALGLAEAVTADVGATAALEWASARGVLTTVEQTERRLRRMDQDEAALKTLVEGMGTTLGLALPKDTVAAAKMLDARWQESVRVERDRDQLAPDVQAARSALERAVLEVDYCRNVLADLAAKAGLQATDRDGMDAICLAHRRRLELQGQQAQLLASLNTAGDQLPEADLREAWGDRDLDEVAAELETARARATDVDGERVAAVEAAMAARQALAAVQDQAGVAAAVAAREAAIADLHETVERYVDLSLARDLIQEAIDKVRTRQQDPLVARAGALFSAMTQQAYVSVGADIDAKGEPIVVGHSRGGASVTVSDMSDGTRDQLYLAFRLAGLESYCRAAEPLPFVADDILVHFDDARSAATLDVLAAFGETTQVLLFTHHQSVRDAAEGLVKSGKAQIIDFA